MAKKVTSWPLYGPSATREEIEAIGDHMRAFTDKLLKNPKKARRFLEDIGALAPKAKPDNATPDVS